MCAELVASCHSNRGRVALLFLAIFSTLCMLLGYDNIAVRYITPAHGVCHSERHFMLYNHSIYISICIKILMPGVVHSALPYYLKDRSEGDWRVSQVLRVQFEIWGLLFSLFPNSVGLTWHRNVWLSRTTQPNIRGGLISLVHPTIASTQADLGQLNVKLCPLLSLAVFDSQF